MKLKNRKKIFGVVSHDAGGAEVLSSWILNNKKEYRYCLKGPALKIFKKKKIKIKNQSIKNLEKKSDFLNTSTSWPETLELKEIKILNKKKKNKFLKKKKKKNNFIS